MMGFQHFWLAKAVAKANCLLAASDLRGISLRLALSERSLRQENQLQIISPDSIPVTYRFPALRAAVSMTFSTWSR